MRRKLRVLQLFRNLYPWTFLWIASLSISVCLRGNGWSLYLPFNPAETRIRLPLGSSSSLRGTENPTAQRYGDSKTKQRHGRDRLRKKKDAFGKQKDALGKSWALCLSCNLEAPLLGLPADWGSALHGTENPTARRVGESKTKQRHCRDRLREKSEYVAEPTRQ